MHVSLVLLVLAAVLVAAEDCPGRQPCGMTWTTGVAGNPEAACQLPCSSVPGGILYIFHASEVADASAWCGQTQSNPMPTPSNSRCPCNARGFWSPSYICQSIDGGLLNEGRKQLDHFLSLDVGPQVVAELWSLDGTASVWKYGSDAALRCWEAAQPGCSGGDSNDNPGTVTPPPPMRECERDEDCPNPKSCSTKGECYCGVNLYECGDGCCDGCANAFPSSTGLWRCSSYGDPWVIDFAHEQPEFGCQGQLYQTLFETVSSISGAHLAILGAALRESVPHKASHWESVRFKTTCGGLDVYFDGNVLTVDSPTGGRVFIEDWWHSSAYIEQALEEAGVTEYHDWSFTPFSSGIDILYKPWDVQVSITVTYAGYDRYSQFLSFLITLPPGVAGSEHAKGLCVPHDVTRFCTDRTDIIGESVVDASSGENLSASWDPPARVQKRDGEGASERKVSRDEALAECHGLTGGFFTSCVFDIQSTGYLDAAEPSRVASQWDHKSTGSVPTNNNNNNNNKDDDDSGGGGGGGSSGCIHKDMTVLSDQGILTVGELTTQHRLWDEWEGRFVRVLGDVHAEHEGEVIFLHVTLANGATLTLTPSHRVFLASLHQYVLASELVVGDLLQTTGFEHHAIMAVERIVSDGYRAPLTETGRIYPNGVHVSCFSNVAHETGLWALSAYPYQPLSLHTLYSMYSFFSKE